MYVSIYMVSAEYKLPSNIWTLIQIVHWSLAWSVYIYSLTLLVLVNPRFWSTLLVCFLFLPIPCV